MRLLLTAYGRQLGLANLSLRDLRRSLDAQRARFLEKRFFNLA